MSLEEKSQRKMQRIEDISIFKKIDWKDIDDNLIRMIGKDWMLITAGSESNYNMMTASWGNMGWIWEKPMSIIYVRPQRHTYKYTELEDYYTISFYNDKSKESLKKMGALSGKNFDKMNYENLTPIITPNTSVAFEEAYLILECKKVYRTILKESEFLDKTVVDDKYPDRDFHTVYYGEILNVWKKAL